MFFAKFAENGDLIRLKHGGGPGNDLAYAMSVDEGGSCFATGQFENTASFGTASLSVGPDSRTDIFVTRIGPPFFEPPLNPKNMAPTNASFEASLPVTLLASSFSDPDSGDTHTASQWLINRTLDDLIVFDSGSDTNNKTAIVVSNLAIGATYSWRVRYQDAHTLWGDYSQPTTFTLGKRSQSIDFRPLSRQTFGDAPFALSATASSGLPVSFSVLSGPVIVSGNILTMTGAGLVVLRASQPGDATYTAAPNVDQVLIVVPWNNVITDFQQLANGMSAFRFYGESGTNYVVQGSTNLVNWLSLATNQISGLGYLEFTDSTTTNYHWRFYRVTPWQQ